MQTDPMGRRTFLAMLPAGALLASNVDPRADVSGSGSRATYFPLSYLYCTPNDTDILVRVQIECIGRIIDHDTGKSDEYVMGVVAKTGMTLNADGQRTPGYDYWIIFSGSHVFTRRTHASSYANNPTTLTHEQFGLAKWRLQVKPARELHTAADVRWALEQWLALTAITRFTSRDGKRSFEVEYPVKWADYGLQREQFRVETGPVFMLDPDEQRVGSPPKFESFQWAYFDYHDFEHVRCLLDKPVSIFVDATFAPPHEHGREAREHPPLTSTQVRQLHDRLLNDVDAPLSPDKMDLLFSTDHYGDVADHLGRTRLFAFDAKGC